MIPAASQARLDQIEVELSQLYDLAARAQREADEITPFSVALSIAPSYEEAVKRFEASQGYYIKRADELRRSKIANSRESDRKRLEEERDRIISYWGEQAARISLEEEQRRERVRLWNLKEEQRIAEGKAKEEERIRLMEAARARVEAQQQAEREEARRLREIEEAARIERARLQHLEDLRLNAIREQEDIERERAAQRARDPERYDIRERLSQIGPYIRTPTTPEQDQIYWRFDDPRWRSISVPFYSDSALWESLLRRIGFDDSVALDPNRTALGQYAINDLRARGYDFRRKHPDRKTFNIYWGFVRPDGTIQDIKIEGSDPTRHMLGYFMLASGAWLGPLASAINVPAPVLSAGIRIAAGADPLQAVIGAALPTIAQNILPEFSALPDTQIGEILSADEWLTTASISAPTDIVASLDIYAEPLSDLLTAPDLLLIDPMQELPEPLPVFEPVAEPLPELPAELLPLPEPVFEPVAELLAPPDLPPELLPPTIEPPGVPIMDDFFAAEDYAFPTWEVGSVDDGFFFDFDSVEPIPTVDAGDWFVGPMPLPDFPAIEDDFSWTAPVEAGAVEDLITVGDIQIVTGDVAANYIGTGGSVEVRDFARPTTETGATVIEVIKDATNAMIAALGLVNAYRALTSKPQPNPVAQARQGQNTVRANPNGTITTTAPTGQTRTARPPVGQPQMTTDGTMIVNNGDGTYTRIGRDGASVINRYPVDVTERFGAVAASPYTLPLLLAGGAALVLFASRKR